MKGESRDDNKKLKPLYIDGTTIARTIRFQVGASEMTTLNPEIKETFSKIKVFPVGTASRSGIPNVSLIAFVQLVSDDTIWLADNYMKKTIENLRENPRASISVWDQESKKCFQIKGSVEIKTSGPDYEKMKKMVHDKKPELPAKSLVIFTVTEVFSCVPGPDAGKSLLG